MILFPQNNQSRFELLVGNTNIASVYNTFQIDFNDVFTIPFKCSYKDIAVYYDGVFRITEENWTKLLYELIDMPYLYDRSGRLVVWNNEFISNHEIFNSSNFNDIKRSFGKYVGKYFPEENSTLIEEFFES
jgi:glutathionyl-hydroquinone reductase